MTSSSTERDRVLLLARGDGRGWGIGCGFVRLLAVLVAVYGWLYEDLVLSAVRCNFISYERVTLAKIRSIHFTKYWNGGDRGSKKSEKNSFSLKFIEPAE